MDGLYKKLNYKGQKRIALLGSPDEFLKKSQDLLPDIQIDNIIDPRYPYEFILAFVRKPSDVDSLAPRALHNLVSDGILWFAFPRKNSELQTDAGLDRDHGWKTLTDSCFKKVRLVSVDENWSALRFRNARFIKSTKQ